MHEVEKSCGVAIIAWQARMQGGFGGFNLTPLSAAVIHMNLYDTYVSHTL